MVALDNLKRRGSELNLVDFKNLGVEFVHGDIRNPDDLGALDGSFDLLIEASAEPSVHAGLDAKPAYVLHTNLSGTLNCLEFARNRCGAVIFLSTSRVYSIPALQLLPLSEGAGRFDIDADGILPRGCSVNGISEEFDTSQFRSLYGTTKLASELVIQEYCELFGLPIVVNRCGVIAGRGQWGKADQGIYTLWVARHFFGKGLTYTGFGGTGKQVRDLLHPDDLFALIETECLHMDRCAGQVFNIGGGVQGSTSLRHYTELCRKITGNQVEMSSDPATAKVDVPYYASDNSKASDHLDWQPKKGVRDIVEDIFDWLKAEQDRVRPIFD